MASFPGALASFTGFTSSHTLAADSHAAQHNLEQGEVLAVQTKVGTGSSVAVSSTVLRGTGAGASAWGQVALTTDVTGTLPVANGGTGATSLTALTLPSAILANPVISGTVTGGATYTSPTLTTPIIASFVNATHDHTNAAGGGALGTNSVPTAAVVNDAITDAKLIYGKLRTRQGGSATDWSSVGTTTFDYSATDVFMQAGAQDSSAGAAVTVTFPTAFNQIPLVFGMVLDNATFSLFQVQTVSATQFTFSIVDTAGSRIATKGMWFAIGQ